MHRYESKDEVAAALADSEGRGGLVVCEGDHAGAHGAGPSSLVGVVGFRHPVPN